MREVMRNILNGEQFPDHAGLAYEVWAPLETRGDKTGKLDEKQRDEWLARFAKMCVPEGYERAFMRWEADLKGDPTTSTFEAKAQSRILIGHGNPAPTEVGLTLHRTWGVPAIPGSALKGLLAHYVDATYGSVDGDQDPDRALFHGVTWKGTRMVEGPGDVYRRIFGAPDVDEDPLERGATVGEVIFHDALWVPDNDAEKIGQKLPLVRDILTVHQKNYYRESKTYPNDYDEPNPVAFLTVAPGARFLIAWSVTSGDEALQERVGRYLREALELWGVGGKTAAGYGRLKESAEPVRRRARPTKASPAVQEFEQWLASQKEAKVDQVVTLERVETEWMPRLTTLRPDERNEVAKMLGRAIKSPKPRLRERVERLRERLSEK